MADKTIDIILAVKDEASAALKKVASSASDLGSTVKDKVGEATRQSTMLAAAGVTALGAALYDSTKSAMESQNVSKQLEAVLKSTGKAAGVSKEQLDAQSSALQKMTMFSDEAIGSAQSLLLTFTGIKGPIFTQATQTVLDMSQALGQDLKSSSIQLGKALNDPIKGVTALQRVGVSFTDAQKTQIQTLVDSGKTMEAQKLILKELQTEFGGSAKAAGETFAGKLAILANQFDNLKETVGGVILDALTPLANILTNLVESVDIEGKITRVKDAFVGLKALIVDGDFTGAFRRAFNVEEDSPVVDVILKIRATIAEFLQSYGAQIIEFFKTFGLVMLAVIPTLAAVGVAVGILSNPLVQLGLVITALITGYQWLKRELDGGNPVLTAVASVFSIVWGEMRKVWDAISSALLPALSRLWEQIGPIVTPALKLMGGILGGVVLAAIIATCEAIRILVQVISALINAVASVIGFFKDMYNWVSKNVAVVGDLGNKLSKISVSGALGSIKNLLGLSGARAAGGPVNMGESYLVGENGPEIFTPSRSGKIIPNGGIGATINNVFNIGSVDSRETAEYLAEQVAAIIGRQSSQVLSGQR